MLQYQRWVLSTFVTSLFRVTKQLSTLPCCSNFLFTSP